MKQVKSVKVFFKDEWSNDSLYWLNKCYKGIKDFGCYAMRHAFESGMRIGREKEREKILSEIQVKVKSMEIELFKAIEDTREPSTSTTPFPFPLPYIEPEGKLEYLIEKKNPSGRNDCLVIGIISNNLVDVSVLSEFRKSFPSKEEAETYMEDHSIQDSMYWVAEHIYV